MPWETEDSHRAGSLYYPFTVDLLIMHSLIWHYALSHGPILPQNITYMYVVLVYILAYNVKIFA